MGKGKKNRGKWIGQWRVGNAPRFDFFGWLGSHVARPQWTCAAGVVNRETSASGKEEQVPRGPLLSCLRKSRTRWSRSRRFSPVDRFATRHRHGHVARATRCVEPSRTTGIFLVCFFPSSSTMPCFCLEIGFKRELFRDYGKKDTFKFCVRESFMSV